MGRSAPELLAATLDLLILRVLVAGDLHGYRIAQRFKPYSDDVLPVSASSRHPALKRLLRNDWGTAERIGESNRRLRYYEPTAAKSRHAPSKVAEFKRAIGAIHRALETA